MPTGQFPGSNNFTDPGHGMLEVMYQLYKIISIAIETKGSSHIDHHYPVTDPCLCPLQVAGKDHASP